MAGNSIDAKLIIAADVADAIRKLQELRKTAQDTGAVVAKVGSGAGGAAGTGSGGARARTDAERTAAAESKRLAAEAAADRKRLAREEAAEAAATLRLRRKEEAEANRARIQQEQAATREVRAQTNLQKQAYRQLPAQITDITTSIASGMPVWMVAIQQGGQIRDSFGGIGAAARALVGLLTPLRLVIGGVATVLGALGLAALQGYREQDALNKQLALTGNIAGTSAGQIDRQARAIAASTGAAIDGVRDTLAALLATGNYTDATLEGAGRAVTALRRLTGQSAEEAVQSFEAQGEGITAWALKANRAYNFLTAEQLAYVRRLESEGRTAEATKFVNEELAATLEQRSVPAVGALEKAWKAVGSVLSSVWDTLKGIGRDDTPEERLAKLTKTIAELERQRDNGGTRGGRRRSTFDAEIESARAEVEQINRDLQRRSENSARLRTEQDKALRDQKAYQDALAGLTKAQADKRLAALEAALDAESAAVERADATGLQRAEDKALKLNAIEARRLRARAANLRAELEREARRPTDEKDLDGLGKSTRLANLEKQILDTEGRIRALAIGGQAIVDAAALNQSREQAQRWAEIWQRANDQVRSLARENALADDSGGAQERAARAAALRSAQLRKELADLTRDLRNSIATATVPGTADLLSEQLAKLEREGAQAIAEQERLGRLGSVIQQSAEALDRLRLVESQIEQQVIEGAISTEEAEKRKFSARDAAIPQLEELLRLQRELAKTPGEQTAADDAELKVKKLKDRTTEAARVMRDSFATSASRAFQDFVLGVQTAEQAFKSFIANIARAALDLIAKRFGEEIATSFFPKDGGGGFLASIGSFLMGLFHTGGVVGAGASRMARAVPAAALLAGAQVLHAGGIAGALRPNEQLAVLEKGEEVLTADDPRHVANFRAGPLIGQMSVSVDTGGAGAASAQDAVLAENLARGIRAKVGEYIQDELRPGGLLANR